MLFCPVPLDASANQSDSDRALAQDASPYSLDAGANCLNLKGVFAIKLEAAPRYQFVGSRTYKNKLERTPGLTLPYFSELRRACSRARIGACG